MIKKPDVLSEKKKLICSLVDDKHPYRQLKAAIDEACVHQRDFDAEYYEPLIKEMYEALEWVKEDMETDKGTRIKVSTQTAVWKALAKVDKGIKKGL